MTPLAQPMTRMFPWKNQRTLKHSKDFQWGNWWELKKPVCSMILMIPVEWMIFFRCIFVHPTSSGRFLFFPAVRYTVKPDGTVEGAQWNVSWLIPEVFSYHHKSNQICLVTSTSTGWWYTYPSEKYESQLGWLFPTEWKVIKFHGSKPPTR